MRHKYILLYYIISVQCPNDNMHTKNPPGESSSTCKLIPRVPPLLAFSGNFLSHGLSRCPLLLPSFHLTLSFSHVPLSRSLSSAASDLFHS